MKNEIEKSTIKVGGFNSLLWVINRLSRKKISKDIMGLNNIINLLDLTDIYKILHPTGEYTFFSSSNKTFTNIDHILGYKTQHIKKKTKTETIESMFLNHNENKLEINNRSFITGKF